MKESDVLQRALDTYGIVLQENVAIEEMAELTKEIIKRRRGKDNEEAIKEEIADVMIIMLQLAAHYGVEDVEYHIDYKLKRLEERINAETN